MLKRNGVHFLIATQMLLLAASGCQLVDARVKSKHDDKHQTVPVSLPATVDVGGHVQNPARLELPLGGMTIRRALALAGGLRETRARRTSLNVSRVDLSGLEDLREASLAYGRLDLQKQLFNHVEGFDSIIGKSREQVFREFSEIEAQETQRFNELNSLLQRTAPEKKKPLSDFRTFTRQVGDAEERLRLHKLGLELGVTEEQLRKKLNSTRRQQQGELDKLAFHARPATETTVFAEAEAYFVALQRGDSNLPVTYYIPYELCVAGIVGDISMQPGDLVQVIDAKQTSLYSPITAGQDSSDIVIQGFVNLPGSRHLSGGLSRFGDVTRRDVSGGPTINDPRTIWSLTRTSEFSFGREIYVFPPSLIATNGALRDARILGGDIFELTITPRIPIVLESLAEKVLRTRTEDEVRKRLLANAESWKRLGGGRNELVAHRMRQNEQSRSSLGRELNSLGGFVRARTGGLFR